MEYRPLNYSWINKEFSYGQPNRLSVVVHPGWDHRVGEGILPLWEKYLDQVVQDPNQALLVISDYGPETVHKSTLNDPYWIEFAKKQKQYNEQIREWVALLAENFQGRFAEWKQGLLPNDEEHGTWLKEALGNPPDILQYESVKDGIKEVSIGSKMIKLGVSDFFTIDFSGMYYDTCVAWQMESFPCSSTLRPKGFWSISGTR